MRYLCKKSGSGVKNTLLQDISLFLKEIRKVNHTHCILFFSKRGLSAPLEKWNEGRQPLWGFLLEEVPCQKQRWKFTSALLEGSWKLDVLDVGGWDDGLLGLFRWQYESKLGSGFRAVDGFYGIRSLRRKGEQSTAKTHPSSHLHLGWLAGRCS